MKLPAELVEINDNFMTFRFYGGSLELEKGKYNLEISKYRNKRSLEQNAMLWGLINNVADATQNEPMDVYISALEHANAKYEWIAGLPFIEDELKRNFRAVKPYGTVTTESGQVLVRYKVFIGSSKFNTEEMTKLIEYVQTIESEV